MLLAMYVVVATDSFSFPIDRLLAVAMAVSWVIQLVYTYFKWKSSLKNEESRTE